MMKTPPWSLFQEQTGAVKSLWRAAQCSPPPTLGAQGRAVVRMMMMAMTSAVMMGSLTRGAWGEGVRGGGGGGDSCDTSKGSEGVGGSCAMTGNGGSTPLGDGEGCCGVDG